MPSRRPAFLAGNLLSPAAQPLFLAIVRVLKAQMIVTRVTVICTEVEDDYENDDRSR